MSKKLKLFRITGDMFYLDKALEIFVDLSCVHPIKSNEFTDRVHGLQSLPTDNPWQTIYQELLEIEKESHLSIKTCKLETIDYSLEKIKDYIHDAHLQLHKLYSSLKDGENLLLKYQDALTQVQNINKLELSLDDLFSCEYVDVKFGKLPKDSLDILKLYDNKPIIYQLFKEEKSFYWCMYMTSKNMEREIDNIFSSLYFERVYIPDFIHGTPEEAIKALSEEIHFSQENVDEIRNEINEFLKQNNEKLSEIKSELLFLNRVYDAKKYVVILGDKFGISGFIYEYNVDAMKKRYQELTDIEIEIMPSDFDKRLKAPRSVKELKKPCM